MSRRPDLFQHMADVAVDPRYCVEVINALVSVSALAAKAYMTDALDDGANARIVNELLMLAFDSDERSDEK